MNATATPTTAQAAPSKYVNNKLPKEGTKTHHAITVMRANEDKPMEEVINLIHKASGVPMNIAKNYYLWCVREKFCVNPIPAKEPKPKPEPKRKAAAEAGPVVTKAAPAPTAPAAPKAAAKPAGKFGGKAGGKATGAK